MPRFAIACLAALLCAAPSTAQTFRGGIQGTVVDETGGALPGATVTVTNAAIGFTRAVDTDAGGAFFLSELPLGDYDVAASP
jgi:hypothetical protein